MGITQQTNSNNITKTRTVTSTVTNGSKDSVAAPGMISSIMTHTCSETMPGTYASPQGHLLRCGYMVGFSYEYSKRWLLDGLIQQSPVKPDVQVVTTSIHLFLPLIYVCLSGTNLSGKP